MLPVTTFAKRKILGVLLVSVFLLFFNSMSKGASGDVDTSFNASVGITSAGSVSKLAIQPDGKIIFIGDFRYVGGKSRANLARLNQDGTIDLTFNPPEFASSSSQLAVFSSVAVQSTGKIILGGAIGYINGTLVQKGLVRLNADGSLDNDFTNNAGLTTFGQVTDLKITPDDKIIASGIRFSNPFAPTIIRLTSNGTIDFERSFSNFTGRIGIQTDGKIVTTIGNTLTRLNSDGSVDFTFTTSSFNETVKSIAFQTDGKILVGGRFSQVNGFPMPFLGRFNADGTVDTSFNTGSGPNSYVENVNILPDGKIMIAGLFLSYNSIIVVNVARVATNGALDTTFQSPFAIGTFPYNFIFNDLKIQSNGKIMLGGGIFNPIFSDPLNNRQRVVRLNSDGSVDSSFGVFIGTNAPVYKVLALNNNQILIAGGFNTVNNTSRSTVSRLNSNGLVDLSFNLAVTYSTVLGLDIQTDGKILVAGLGNPIWDAAHRVNSDGSFDIPFNAPSSREIKFLSDGKILISGSVSNNSLFYLDRFNSNGVVDSTFDVQPNGFIRKVLIQPNGKILVCGDFTTINSVGRNRIARLNADGTLDTTFVPSGGTNATVYDIALQSDGKVIIGGNFTGVNFVNRRYLARLNMDGSLDTTFTPDVDNTVHSLKLQPNGKILVGGVMNTINGLSRKGFARLNVDGSVDTSFNVGSGANGIVWSIDLQTDNKILIGGEFTKFNAMDALGVARLLNDNNVQRNTLFDFDGDNKADISVFRSQINRWYLLQSANSQVTEQNFGINGDVIAPADFDGDGKTDIAIFRNGDWWYKSSINGNQINTRFGQAGDVPRPADFDGDGKADFIVYRPTNNVWYRLGSTGQTSIIAFGAAGDNPVMGDFDGDGKADVAIYRPNTGQWWYQSSLDNSQRATQFGIASDTPVPMDYDGDGKTDLAVYRSQTGVWYILNSANSSFTVIPFGLLEDKPVPADYDGDGKADIAVFRPSTGLWYLLRSTAGFTALQFGVATDTPIPNAFVP